MKKVLLISATFFFGLTQPQASILQGPINRYKMLCMRIMPMSIPITYPASMMLSFLNGKFGKIVM